MKDPIADEIERERNFNYSEGEDAKADANVNRKSVVIEPDKELLDGKIDFGIRKKVKIEDAELRIEYIRREHDDAISKGYIDNGLSSKLGDGYVSSRRSNRQSKFGEELSADSGKSTDNEGRISESDEHFGNVKYSLKDRDPIADEIERERNFNYSEGEDAKADANVNRNKVYTKQAMSFSEQKRSLPLWGRWHATA